MGLTEAGIECQPNGVCRDIAGSTPESTVCSDKCYSCTYKKCCNKVYTSQYAKCSINGWRKKDTLAMCRSKLVQRRNGTRNFLKAIHAQKRAKNAWPIKRETTKASAGKKNLRKDPRQALLWQLRSPASSFCCDLTDQKQNWGDQTTTNSQRFDGTD
ncbi:hypothetical protein niasHS_012493 [Heterodera schachtii]|uniref:Uncharacterized protein n=1 Tax=Heterodera schachtii TaxID=97005 RepID=A0ABD2IQS4_HETSC